MSAATGLTDAQRLGSRRSPRDARTHERDRSSALDALRAIAALMVLVAHASFIANNGYPGPVGLALRQMLGAGVLLFFALSGYLIAGPHVRALVTGGPLPAPGAYALRRAARILPAYWVAFIAVVILLPPPGGVRAYQWPVHLFLLQSSWPVAGEPTRIFFVAWTLGVEAAFYAFVPLAATVLRRLRRSPWPPAHLAALTLLGALVTAACSYFSTVELSGHTGTLALLAQIGLWNWLYAFCPGIVLVLLTLRWEEGRARRTRRILTRGRLMLPIAAGLWGVGYWMERQHQEVLYLNYQVPLVVASGLILAVFLGAGPVPRRAGRWLAPVGLVSYGIYLWHDTVVQYIWHHTSIGVHGGGGAWVLDTLLVAAITAPLALVSWLAIERPAISWAAARVRRRAPAGPQERDAERDAGHPRRPGPVAPDSRAAGP